MTDSRSASYAPLPPAASRLTLGLCYPVLLSPQAYILKVLGQDDEFNSLHWFESVEHYIARRRHEVNKAKAGRRPTEEEAQMMQLSNKRLDALHQEMELLRWTFNGARIFFRDPKEEAKAPATG